ncbi:DUF2642 domain-containing protein [Paenibacillus marinisediminis]
MSSLSQYMNTQVEVEISGKHIRKGVLIDVGLDMMVLFHEQQFFYIPLVHVQRFKAVTPTGEEGAGMVPSERPIDYGSDSLSFRKILNYAKGQFVEIAVTGDKPIHGYLTSIMNDYFVFYSPVYKAVFVSMNHLKWLIPYRSDITPYSLSHQSMPFNPVHISLSRTFEELCKRLEGNLVMFDHGDHPDKIGLLNKVNNQAIELINATGDKVSWNLNHLKTVNIP